MGHGAANSCPGVDDAANNLSKHDAATGRSGHGATNCNARWSKCPGDHDTTRSAVYTTRNAISGSTNWNPGRCECARDDDTIWSAIHSTWHAIWPGRSKHAIRTTKCAGSTPAGATWYAIRPGGRRHAI